MTPDLKRLCEAIAEMDIGAGLHEVPIDDVYTATMLTPDGAEAIVRAVLAELREVSDEGHAAMEAALKRPRQHVGHRARDGARGAYIALDAYVDHILDTKARRAAALDDMVRADGELL